MKSFHSLTHSSLLAVQNPNVVHYEMLVKAEIKDLRTKKDDAMSLYNAAIDHARRIECIHDHGYAEQRLGEFYIRSDEKEEARRHMLLAIDLFREWGANGKINQLKQAYGGLLGSADC